MIKLDLHLVYKFLHGQIKSDLRKCIIQNLDSDSITEDIIFEEILHKTLYSSFDIIRRNATDLEA